MLDLGVVNGRRLRPAVQAPTLKDLRPKMAALKDRHGATVGAAEKDITVEAWMDLWLDTIASRRDRVSTIQTYRSYIRNWIIPHLGHVKLSRLQPEHAEALYDAMKKKDRADSTIRQVHAILAKAMKDAVRRRRLARSPIEIAIPPETPKGTSHKELSLEEAKRVLGAADGPRSLARLTVALMLGVRQGEALGLRWSDIAFVDGGGYMSIERTVQRQTGQGLVVGPPKSDRSVRVIPLIEPVAKVLAAYRGETDGEGYVFGGEKPMEPRRDYEDWRRACIRAGVTPVPLHGARASQSSLLREIGASEQTIADLLGHANVRTTMKHYIRSSESQQLEAMREMGQRLLEA